MKNLSLLFFAVPLFILGAVFAQTSSQPADWGKLISDPMFLTLAASFLSSIVTMPLTELLKRLGKWNGESAQVVNGLVNTVVLAVLPFLLGVYTFDLRGLGMAALGAAVGYFADRYIYKTGRSISGANTPPFLGQ